MPTLRAKAVAIVAELLIKETTRPDPMKVLEKCPPPEYSAPEAPAPRTIPAIALVSKKDVKKGVAPAGTRVVVSDQKTMLYQLNHLTAEATLLETHLSEGSRMYGEKCDCVAKHSGKLKIFAQETIPIASRAGMDISIYNDIIAWSSKVEDIPMDAPDTTFQADSGQAGIFRKRLFEMLQETKQGVK